MPQVFQVLKCYKCSMFQVHQIKKSIKWDCKLCGEKQSFKRHYGQGTAKECRLHVQKLNGIRGELDGLSENIDINTLKEEQLDIKHETIEKIPHKPSKWTNFVDRDENVELKDDPMYIGITEVVLEVPKKKRKFNYPKAFRNPLRNQSLRDDIAPENEEKKSEANVFINPLINNNNTIIIINNTFRKSSNEDVRDDKPTKEHKFEPPNPQVINNSKWAVFLDQNSSEDDNGNSTTPLSRSYEGEHDVLN